MAEQAKKWKTTCNRFVVFLDIMGFRDRVFRESHETVKNMLESLRPTIQDIEEEASNLLKKIESDEIVEAGIQLVTRPVSFSDSIILISSGESWLSGLNTVVIAKRIFNEAMKKGVPLKGAVAFGEQTADFNNSLHFGKPLIDAFELQNELSLYGLVLHYSTEQHLIESDSLKNFGDFIVKYRVPMKSGTIYHYVLNWMQENEVGFNPINIVSQLYKNVSGGPRLYVDNTLEFVEWLEKEKQKKK